MSVPSVESLVGVVEGSTPDPLERVRAAVALSTELARVGDEVVQHLVARAREAGLAWSEIGRALGVTKQAAQQRFAPRQSIPRDQRGIAARMTERAHRLLTLADVEARALGHSWIGTEHLLLGILRDVDATAARALGITHSSAREVMIEWVPAGESSEEHLTLTPRTMTVLALGLAEALKLGENRVDPEHILLALLDESQGVAAQALERLGATYDGVRVEILRLRGAA